MAEGGNQLTFEEKEGDLFKCDREDALAHCVSTDMRMGKGIAVIFKRKFGGVRELLDQKQKSGGVAFLQKDNRFIFYLVTKEKVYDKPTYETLESSLQSMKRICQENNIKKLSMPRIGCGLDGLQWSEVTKRIKDVFRDVHMQITIYTLVMEDFPSESTQVPGSFKFSEKTGDLFKCSEKDSLAHCVSQDLVMSKGIATIFKRKFGREEELRRQGATVGGVAILKVNSRFVYYLVTKAVYKDKPTYDDLQQTLEAMKAHLVTNGVKTLCMPRIGCGLDGLQWRKVTEMIKKTFGDMDIEINVYSLA